MSQGHVELAPDEVPAGRPFAHPGRTREDLAKVRLMAAVLRRIVSGPLAPGPRPLVREVAERGERSHRVIVCDEARLRAAAAPELVGFFAERRPGIDHAALTETDDTLVREFPAHPGVLSYSSLELLRGDWGNLIVLDSPDAREHWRTSARHARAVEELAPRHYAAVRLHVGRFPGGLEAGDVVLVRTKYFDFGEIPPWRAERALR